MYYYTYQLFNITITSNLQYYQLCLHMCIIHFKNNKQVIFSSNIIGIRDFHEDFIICSYGQGKMSVSKIYTLKVTVKLKTI